MTVALLATFTPGRRSVLTCPTVLALALGILPCPPALAIVPIVGQLALPPPTTINAGPANQMDPHVSGNLAAYISEDTPGGLPQVRYFNFATGVDTGIPNQLTDGTFVRDFLPDVSGTRIAFTRVGPNAASIQLADVATGAPLFELDPQANSQRIQGAIGGDTVVWVDFGAGSGGEILAFALPGGPPIQLTANSPIIDRRAGVAHDGSIIVWEQCASGAAPCDIYKAVRTTGGWAVSAVTLTPDDESSSDTNGAVIVYSAARANALGGRDIFWTDLGTGVETQLELDGFDFNPNVSGSFIAFEHVAPGDLFADLLLYDMATNRIYHLTGTPSRSEFLSDVSVSGRTVRAVWSVLEGSDQNVYGLTVLVVPPDCGNGSLGAGEQCDDGNGLNGDCCSEACTLETAGSPCDGDSDRCTPDTCDGVGACVGAPLDPDACLDDFLCYRTGPKVAFTPIRVELTDRFETATLDVTRIAHLCTPADRNGEGTVDAVTHLQSYRAEHPGHAKRTVTVRNDLGELILIKGAPDFVFAPTAKSLTGPVPPRDPSAHEVDRFKCYNVRVKPGTVPFPRRRVVTVGDQFTSPPKQLILTKPRHLCTPAGRIAQPLKHPDVHLVCYTARSAPGQPRRASRPGVHTNDEFGARSLRVLAETELCIPSTIASCAGAGVSVGGSCWYLGAYGASCDAACAAVGGTYDAATESFAGSGGTDANCLAVLATMGSDGSLPFSSGDCTPLGQGLGCFGQRTSTGTAIQQIAARCVAPPTTSSAAYSFSDPTNPTRTTQAARVCACTTPSP